MVGGWKVVVGKSKSKLAFIRRPEAHSLYGQSLRVLEEQCQWLEIEIENSKRSDGG